MNLSVMKAKRMKLTIKSLFFLSTLIFLSACGGENSDGNGDNSQNQNGTYKSLDSEADLDEYMVLTDQVADSTFIPSLRYSKENGQYIEVQTAVDKNNQISRLLEQYSEGEGQEFGTKLFYYQNGVKKASVKRFERHTAQNINFVEQVSYYDNDGKVTRSKERIASFESDLSQFDFKEIQPINHDDGRAMRVLEQKGEFTTTFQGFVDAGPQTYLIVGENKEDGFTSALALPAIDPSLQELRDNSKKMIGKKVFVKFAKRLDPSMGYEFQEYISHQFE